MTFENLHYMVPGDVRANSKMHHLCAQDVSCLHILTQMNFVLVKSAYGNSE